MQRHAAAAAAWCFIILVFPVYGCFCLLKSTARQGKSRPGRYVFFFHHTHSLPVWVLIGCSSPFSLSLALLLHSSVYAFTLCFFFLCPSISLCFSYCLYYYFTQLFLSLCPSYFLSPSFCIGTVFVSGLGMGGTLPYGSVQEMI